MILMVPAVQAGDLRPPHYRFEPWSTVAGWDFLTDQEIYSIRPDADVPLWIGDAADPLQDKFQSEAPYPSAALFGDVRYTPAHGGAYFGGFAGNNGIVFVVPNWLKAFEFTQLRVQVTYQGTEPPTTVVGYQGIPGNSNANKEIPIARVPVQDPSLPPGSSFFYEDWLLSPSSTWQQVVVFVPEETLILHVVIDTVSVSPPGIFEDDFEPGDISPWSGR